MTQDYIKANFHTHSVFCDGKDSLEENVLAAIQKEIKILGFSSHSFYPFWTECNMKVQDFDAYCAEINRLKELYREKIDIRLGFEADYLPGITFPTFESYRKFNPEFLIGSVHNIYKKEGIFAVDESPETLSESLKKYYNGNSRKLVCEYFDAEKEMLRCGDFTIIGHPDLVRKFNDRLKFFDETDCWYKREVRALAKEISKAGVIAEINTGGISRGWTKTPYPSAFFLEILHEFNVPVVLSSDAHSAQNLDFGFEEARMCAKKAGYTEIMIPGTGFCRI